VSEALPLLLLVLAGFFVGGAWSARKISVPLMVALIVAALLAGTGAALRLA